MGWGIGFSIGAAFGHQQRHIVSLIGDGAFLMNGLEISLAAEHQVPIIFIIINDSAYGMVYHGQRFSGAESIAWQLPEVDYSKIGAARGLDEFSFESVFEKKKPTLVDVLIDRDFVPPIQKRIQVLNQ